LGERGWKEREREREREREGEGEGEWMWEGERERERGNGWGRERGRGRMDEGEREGEGERMREGMWSREEVKWRKEGERKEGRRGEGRRGKGRMNEGEREEGGGRRGSTWRERNIGLDCEYDWDGNHSCASGTVGYHLRLSLPKEIHARALSRGSCAAHESDQIEIKSFQTELPSR
jgi:hypothetical protein